MHTLDATRDARTLRESRIWISVNCVYFYAIHTSQAPALLVMRVLCKSLMSALFRHSIGAVAGHLALVPKCPGPVTEVSEDIWSEVRTVSALGPNFLSAKMSWCQIVSGPSYLGSDVSVSLLLFNSTSIYECRC